MTKRETLSESLAVELYSAMERLAMALPERWGRTLFMGGGALAFRMSTKARRTVSRNLAHVTGRPASSPLVQAATREAFRSYARYWHDTFFIRSLPSKEFMQRFELKGWEHIEAAQTAGRGAILALPHLGNWDAAGRYVVERGVPVTAVAEELKPARMYRLFYRHRRELGMGIVPLSETRKLGAELMGLLAQNHILALVSDRDLKGRGIEVEMFGAMRRMPAGPALLSLASGSPLMAATCYDIEGGWGCTIHPPLEIERTGVMRDDVATLTQALALEFERDISAIPTQWHMFQPAWDG